MRKTDVNDAAGPFDGDADYLDLTFNWLLARASRVGAEARLREDAQKLPAWNAKTVGDGGPCAAEEETRRRLDGMRERERSLRDLIDRRLAAYRADSSREPLGIDRICEEYALDDDDRTILLMATAAAVSAQLGAEILDPLGGFRTGVDVESLVRFIHPIGNAADWLEARKRFHRSGPMVAGGLIAVSYPHAECSPAALMQATVEITSKGFSAVTGITESDDEEGDDSPSR